MFLINAYDFLEDFKSNQHSYKKCNYYFRYNATLDCGEYIFEYDYYGETLTTTIVCDINGNFKIKNDDSHYYYSTSLFKFLLAISQEERNLFQNNKNEFIKKYSFLPEKYHKYFNLSLGQYHSVLLAREKFVLEQKNILSDLANALDLDITRNSLKCDFEIKLEPSFRNEIIDIDNGFINFDNAGVSLNFGSNKKYKIKNIPEFIKDFDNHVNKKFGKNLAIKLVENNLTDKALEILNVLRKGNYDEKTIHLKNPKIIFSPNVTIELLRACRNSIIQISGKKFLINDNISNVTLGTNENGDIVPSININLEDSFAFSSSNSIIVFNKETYTASIYEFENPASRTLFELFSPTNFDLSFFADIIQDDFYKVISSVAKPKIDDLSKSRIKINLYVSLNIQKFPIFKTEYLIDDKIATQEEIKNDVYFNSIAEAYRLELLSQDLLENGTAKTLDSLNALLITDFSKIKEYATIYLSEDIQNMRRTKLKQISIVATKHTNWLELQINSTEYSKEEISKILAAYNKKKKYVVLNDDFIVLDNIEELEQISQTFKEFNLNKSGDKVRVPVYQALKLDTLNNNESVKIDYDEDVKNVILKIKNFKDTKLEIDELIKNNLRPYQVDAVKWLSTLSELGLSGILADDMGLGKTFELISFHSTLKENAPSLIVCPKSLLYNWKSEFKKWNPEINTVIISGNKENRLSKFNSEKERNTVFIIGYDSLRSDIDVYEKVHFAMVALDEAQYIKNSYTQKSKAVKQLDATCRFALTGTPIENGLNDLWSIFDFIMPNYLLSENDFNDEYLKGFSENIPNIKEKLLAKITPFILRRTKDEVLQDLPPKTIEVIKISLNDKQSQLYNAYMQSTINMAHDDPKNKLKILSALTRLRQICVDPSSFIDNYDELSAKFEYTLDLIDNAIRSNHKILVFSQFTTVLEHLMQLLEKLNIKPLYICGDTKASERIKIADKFNSDANEKVILVSLKAGGLGLNLPGADTVIHLDPWWNYAIEEQATDRAHRIGQTRPVTVYKLVAHDTVEDKVIELQESKKDLYDQVIQSGDDKITGISDEDIKFILS